MQVKLLIEKDKSSATHIISEEQLQEIKAESGPSAYLQCLNQCVITVPKYWANYARKPTSEIFRTNPNDLYHVVNVGGDILKAICDLVDRTWQSNLAGLGADARNLQGYQKLRIHKVERVENVRLWESYAAKRAEICSTQSPYKSIDDLGRPLSTRETRLDEALIFEINECYLFHGTDGSSLEAIKTQGLDSRLSNDRVLFGRGAYFAEASTKADQYAGKYYR